MGARFVGGPRLVGPRSRTAVLAREEGLQLPRQEERPSGEPDSSTPAVENGRQGGQLYSQTPKVKPGKVDPVIWKGGSSLDLGALSP